MEHEALREENIKTHTHVQDLLDKDGTNVESADLQMHLHATLNLLKNIIVNDECLGWRLAKVDLPRMGNIAVSVLNDAGTEYHCAHGLDFALKIALGQLRVPHGHLLLSTSMDGNDLVRLSLGTLDLDILRILVNNGMLHVVCGCNDREAEDEKLVVGIKLLGLNVASLVDRVMLLDVLFIDNRAGIDVVGASVAKEVFGGGVEGSHELMVESRGFAQGGGGSIADGSGLNNLCIVLRTDVVQLEIAQKVVDKLRGLNIVIVNVGMARVVLWDPARPEKVRTHFQAKQCQ